MSWKFRCERTGEIPLSPGYSFAQAFNDLDPKTNSFYILENGDNYIQCGGSKEKCTVEFREYLSDGSFKHYVFYDPAGSNEPAHIPMSKGGVRRQKKHCLNFLTAIKLFACYFNGEQWPSELSREDITDQFKGARKLEDVLEIDLAFAPQSYWQLDSARLGAETNEFRRRIHAAISTGDWSKVKLPPVEFGLRGGDFLPGFKRFEVEIARLSLESTTWDVISIRARPSSHGIVYRVVDEYDTNYRIRPRSSRKPLTLGKLIQLIESMTGWEDDRSMSPPALRDSQGFCNDERMISDLRSFVTVSSEFYPDLEPWYERDADRWVKRKLADLP
jgi:hypothetical protein